MKNKLSLLFSAAVIASLVLSACSASQTDTKTTTALPTDAGETQQTTQQRIYPDLPDKDFEGYEFKFLTRTIPDPDWVDWDFTDICAEAENGDVVNDATFRRNRAVEEKYNVVIKELRMNCINGEFDKTLKATVQTGDAAFDAVLPHPVLAQAYVLGGYFMNVYDVPDLDLTKPWWNQQAIDELTIGDKLYYLFSDITTMDENATAAMIFNKKMMEDYGLEDPYQLVRDGKWTFDKLMSMMKGVAQDINNDGKMDTSDRFGMVAQVDSMWSFYHASGERFITKDDKGYPIIAFGGDRTYAVTEKIFDLMFDKTQVLNAHHLLTDIYNQVQAMFSDNRVLFMWIRMNVVGELRSMEGDFGIIPVPKYEESQDSYYSTVNQHTSSYIAVPQSTPDVERTGIILEALAAESRYTLQPAYYDQALTTKYARDEESAEMLDIIFGSTVFDIGTFYDFGGFASAYAELSRKNTTGIASLYEKSENRMQLDIDKFIEKFNALE